MRLALVFSLVLSVLMVIFALLNNEDIIVEFGLFQTEGPIALVLLVTFIVGIVTGVLAMLPSNIRRRRELQRLHKQGGEAPAAPPVEEPSASSPEPSRPSSTSHP